MSAPLPAPERGLPLFASQTEGDIATFGKKNEFIHFFCSRFALPLNKIGCGSAIQIEQALCIALTFHYLLIS